MKDIPANFIPGFFAEKDFFGGLSPAQKSKDHWGFIKEQGKWVVKPTYLGGEYFSEGLAAASETAQGYSPPKYIAKENGDKIIGNLKWEIHGSFFHWFHAQGTTPVRLKDVTIEVYGPDDFVPGNFQQIEKRIQLTDQFSIELVDSHDGDSKAQSGFAIQGTQKNKNYFSWEWFLVNEGTLAVKLQEKGTLAIEKKKLSNGMEITKTDFLTDISIRLLPGPHYGRPVYRITIFKGSSITWPSVVNGKVVAN